MADKKTTTTEEDEETLDESQPKAGGPMGPDEPKPEADHPLDEKDSEETKVTTPVKSGSKVSEDKEDEKVKKDEPDEQESTDDPLDSENPNKSDKEDSEDPFDDVNEPTDLNNESNKTDEMIKPQKTFTAEEEQDENVLAKDNPRQTNASPENTLDDLAGESSEIKEEETKQQMPSSGIYSSQQTGMDKGTNYSSFRNPNFTDTPNRAGFTNQGNSSKAHVVILIILGIAIIGGTVYLLQNQFKTDRVSISPSVGEVVSSATPEPTPTPEAVDRSKFKIRVLNGTTTAGLAKSVSDKLKELGYQIDKTGNAPKQDYKAAEIKVKSSAAGLYEQLSQDLGSEYTASRSGELKDSDSADAEVILGK